MVIFAHTIDYYGKIRRAGTYRDSEYYRTAISLTLYYRAVSQFLAYREAALSLRIKKSVCMQRGSRAPEIDRPAPDIIESVFIAIN